MGKYEISITYSKTIDASDKAEAQAVLDEIAYKSNLDDEYGAFSSLDVYTNVEEQK